MISRKSHHSWRSLKFFSRTSLAPLQLEDSIFYTSPACGRGRALRPGRGLMKSAGRSSQLVFFFTLHPSRFKIPCPSPAAETATSPEGRGLMNVNTCNFKAQKAHDLPERKRSWAVCAKQLEYCPISNTCFDFANSESSAIS